MLKSPVSYLTDSQYSNLTLTERYLHQANSYVGQKEIGNNWGPFVKATLKLSGIGYPAPWCAAFIKRCLKEANWELNGPIYPASTYYWYIWAKKNSRLITPKTGQEFADTVKRGMLFVWNGPDGGHIGAIVTVYPETLTFDTIEGNTNSKGSREGNQVARKTRSLSSLKVYPRWGFIDIS